ncbi:MAG: hypothetical protein ACJ76B_06975 [Solirubrobacterales bacterium]
MSSIAVFLVLGGATAVAAGQLGKNSVGSKQIKKNAVTSAKIKKNAVSGAKIKKGAVDGSKVKDGSLTGSDINLGSLGTVPSANTANSANSANKAKGVETVVPIFYRANDGSGKQTILSLDGLTITATCPGAGEDVELEATTSVNHALIDFFTPQDGDYDFIEDFLVGEVFDADDGHDQGEFTDIYSLNYANPNGQVVTVQLRDSDPSAGTKFPGTGSASSCYVGGYAVGS